MPLNFWDDPDFARAIITDPAARDHHSWYIDGSHFSVYVSDLDSIVLPALTEDETHVRNGFVERLSLGEDPLRLRPHLQLQVADEATEATLAGVRFNVPMLSALRAASVTVARCRICWPTWSTRAWVRRLNRYRAAAGERLLDVPL